VEGEWKDKVHGEMGRQMAETLRVMTIAWQRICGLAGL